MNVKIPTKRDVKFLLAEDIRQEAGGKISILGYIAGDRFAVGGQPPEGSGNVAFFLPSITFLFVITGGEGSLNSRLRVIAPDKRTAVVDTQAPQPIEKLRDRAAVFGHGAKPFIGPAFGTYTIELTLESSKFSFPVTVEKALEDKEVVRTRKRSTR